MSHPTGEALMAPVAVVGMSCRFPGASDPSRFWENLASGAEDVGPIPEGREGPSSKGPGRAGSIEHPDAFDAGFFGISQREARYMDPQQRLMLELAWESVEDAAIRAGDLQGARWGVFVGACSDDFRTSYLAAGALDRYGHTGTSRCMLANRVSHHFGLRGPSEVVDSGQSSSLTALHRALSSLRLGECDAALVGGVHLNLLQEATDQIQLWGGLSPDGRCHTFDTCANGYVRGEGGGCVVLKPLAAARRDGDHVYGVVRGSAVSNDGGRGGLGVPSQEAQYEAVTEALRTAGARPGDLAYVELHGTGTPVGDPVEARALGAAVGLDRPEGEPLPVGSVKTNVGHLESAAGIAGFIKACLMLEHGALPASLNFTAPPPGVDLAGLGLRVVQKHEERAFGTADVLGVSSFGMGGTNVHVVLGPAPVAERIPVSATPVADAHGAVWCLSGRSPEGVRELAQALLDELDLRGAGADIQGIAATLARRTHWEHRAAVVGASREQIREGLGKVAAGHGFAVSGGWAAAVGADGAHLVRAASDYVHAGDVGTPAAVPAGVRGPSTVPGLPTHRFQRERFPLPPPTLAPAAVPTPSPSSVEPAGQPVPEPDEASYPRAWDAATTRDERFWLTQVLLERVLAHIQGGSMPDLDPEVPLTDLGIDSLTLVEFLDRLTAVTGLPLSETFVFDHPTITEMTECVNKEMESRHG
ncbi:beta-ketoacyl synthase N-terminal-like domain-containing protein [Streptomyces sp. NPDC060209]|uniref:beta-ketoacyl synthase N-terminal-like domain-containing protein n=1 Tax=Streptomyces sp. NPDC060209 TaxID=3347073 RepID=UPI003652A380